MVVTTGERAPDQDVRTLTDALVPVSEDEGEQLAVTFVDYEASKDGVAWSLTRNELHQRVRAVAAWLADRAEPGDRVAILAPQGLEYVVGFFAAVHAGLIAVPLFTPDLPGHADRLERVLDDCAPTCALTSKFAFEQVRDLLHRRGGRAPRDCAAVDSIPDAQEEQSPPASATPDDIAYLQYTSGSTRTPAGVEITHASALANAEQALQAYGGTEPGAVAVSWLPVFHDMGLVLSVLAPVVGRISSVLMDPVAFLQHPVRWLRLLSARPGAISAAPNFAYDYCAAKVTAAEKAWLDLADVQSLINGSEPVRASTIERFHDAFAECGLRPSSHRSSYGLAEATVFVSVTRSGSPPKVVHFDRGALAEGKAEPADPESAPTSTLVSCGNPIGQQVAVVDPSDAAVLADGRVGEIWVQGPNTGRGYWGWDVAESSALFRAGSVSDGYEGAWLRTGDLGVRHGGELFVTGRRKDLIIVDGRNHYPQDVEETAESAHTHVRARHSAAFSVTAEDAERLVVVAEWSKRVAPEERDPGDIEREVRKMVSAAHGVGLSDLVLVEPDTVPRTSSGKVARGLCRQRYLDGDLRSVEGGV